MFNDDDDAPSTTGTYDLHNAEGDYLFSNKQYAKASDCYTRALEMKPGDRECLVCRAKCRLLLGDADGALSDAEASLREDPTYYKGLYQKAEALYFKAQFELALMFYHRGYRVRPECEEFRLGIQKASEAINNFVGTPEQIKLTKEGDLSYFDAIVKEEAKHRRVQSPVRKPPPPDATKETQASLSLSRIKKLLEEMYGDHAYLECLLKDPVSTTGPPKVRNLVEESLDYLNNRTEFWRQLQCFEGKKGRKKQPVTMNLAYINRQLDYLDGLLRDGRFDVIIMRCNKLISEDHRWYSDVPREEIQGKLYSYLGTAYQEKKQYSRAIECYERDLSLGRDNNLLMNQSRALMNLGRMFTAMHKFTEAVAVWGDAIDISMSDMETMWMYHELGHCYLELGMVSEAKKCGQNTLHLANKASDQRWQMNALVLLGQAHLPQEDFPHALHYFKNALEEAKALQDDQAKQAIQRAINTVMDQMNGQSRELTPRTSDAWLKQELKLTSSQLLHEKQKEESDIQIEKSASDVSTKKSQTGSKKGSTVSQQKSKSRASLADREEVSRTSVVYKEEKSRLSVADQKTRSRLSMADKEEGKTSIADQERSKASLADEEKERVSVADQERSKASLADEEKERASVADQERSKASLADEKEKASVADQERSKAYLADEEKEKASVADQERNSVSVTADAKESRSSIVEQDIERGASVEDDVKTNEGTLGDRDKKSRTSIVDYDKKGTSSPVRSLRSDEASIAKSDASRPASESSKVEDEVEESKASIEGKEEALSRGSRADEEEGKEEPGEDASSRASEDEERSKASEKEEKEKEENADEEEESKVSVATEEEDKDDEYEEDYDEEEDEEEGDSGSDVMESRTTFAGPQESKTLQEKQSDTSLDSKKQKSAVGEDFKSSSTGVTALRRSEASLGKSSTASHPGSERSKGSKLSLDKASAGSAKRSQASVTRSQVALAGSVKSRDGSKPSLGKTSAARSLASVTRSQGSLTGSGKINEPPSARSKQGSNVSIKSSARRSGEGSRGSLVDQKTKSRTSMADQVRSQASHADKESVAEKRSRASLVDQKSRSDLGIAESKTSVKSTNKKSKEFVAGSDFNSSATVVIDLSKGQPSPTGTEEAKEISRPSSKKKSEEGPEDTEEKSKEFVAGSDFNSSATVVIDLSKGQPSPTGTEEAKEISRPSSEKKSEEEPGDTEEKSERGPEDSEEKSKEFVAGSDFNSSATVVIDLSKGHPSPTGTEEAKEISRPSSKKKSEEGPEDTEEKSKEFVVGSDFNSSATVVIDLSKGQPSPTGTEEAKEISRPSSKKKSEEGPEDTEDKSKEFVVGSDFNSSATVVIDLSKGHPSPTGTEEAKEISRPSSKKKSEEGPEDTDEKSKEFVAGSDFNSSATVVIDLSKGQPSPTGTEEAKEISRPNSKKKREEGPEDTE